MKRLVAGNANYSKRNWAQRNSRN